MELTGIHHVSAMTADAARNFHFYTQTMGMRLVKKTVNQDDTSSYHLFYADERGNPGTDLTFFDIPHLAVHRPGTSSISSVGLRVPDRGALEYWADRLSTLHVQHTGITQRGGRDTLGLQDFEGQRVVLVADGGTGVAPGVAWDRSPVPQNVGIRGLGPVTLTVRNPDPTIRLLTGILGFRVTGSYPASAPSQPDVVMLSTGVGGAGAELHVEPRFDLPPERLGRGGVHHVAFRVPDDEQYAAWLDHLEGAGIHTSGPINRYYFRSIYFREPNGILYELATDGPGFAVDEDVRTLGESLALPPFLEPQRAAIEARLHPLDTHMH